MHLERWEVKKCRMHGNEKWGIENQKKKLNAEDETKMVMTDEGENKSRGDWRRNSKHTSFLRSHGRRFLPSLEVLSLVGLVLVCFLKLGSTV